MSTKETIVHFTVSTPDIKKLKIIKEKLPSGALDRFEIRYGNILDLLRVKVQEEAITALVQFYDPPLRCFTFQDFQLAPTIEEMDAMLGFSRIKKEFYTGVGKEVDFSDLEKALGMSAAELKVHYKTEGEVHGFKRSYLENQALMFAQKKQWDICGHVLALLVFGVVLLPKNIDYVDPTAIHAFTSFRLFDKDPTPTILANIYYAIHMRYERKRGVLVCCVHLLYSWLTSHLYKASCFIKELTRNDWSQKLRALKADSILWYARKLNSDKIIYKCGEFNNVPLIGTLGCINYNPALALRQLGHSMDKEPSEQRIKELILHDNGKGEPRTWKKVIQAWSNVQRRDFGPKNVIAKAAYTAWVQERVKKVLLPFVVDPAYKPDSPDPVPLSIEEIEGVRAALEASRKEKEKLELDLHQLTNERSQLRFDLKEKNQELQAMKEENDRQRSKRKRATEGYLSANFNLEAHDERLEQANAEIARWRRRYEKASHDKAESEKNLEVVIFELTDRTKDQEDEIRNLKYDLQEALNAGQQEHARRLTTEEELLQRTGEYERAFQAMVSLREVFMREKEIHEAALNERDYWKRLYTIVSTASEHVSMVPKMLEDYEKCRDDYDKLVFLCNDLIQDIPKSLAKAESSPIILPEVVKEFMKLCRDMVDKFQEDIQRRS
ncbi:uncharacterized protein LOC131644755 [Vicia villosa]|uniref:uncharacterized protein LOC131644755 n=1 Tax=Vicia villosa TaxID=3911 RepID=UPI00273AC43D|nr:uncharacterized protein LOC131644755 [Vicia villosa]XP_058771325.1 uncharacterized protein LOC131644755 [Vicia villosa]XP_058771326.1 uncharacterized protein LOC131644755 [Vicia villosa]